MITAFFIIGMVPLVGLAIMSATSVRPELGVTDGRLAACPDTPNAVSTQSADEQHWIEPLRYEGPAAEAMSRLQQIIREWPRAQTVTASENYLRAEFTTAIFRFVDDVEFLIEPDTSTIHFRSASRIGRYDFDVNRSRMEQIRLAFQDAAAAHD